MPILQKRISPLLDTAARLLIVTRHRGKEVLRKEIVLTPLPPAELADNLATLDVDVLLCAALSNELQRELERNGVQVKPHFCGEAEAVLQAFYRGCLNRQIFRMPGCRGNHQGDKCCRRSKIFIKNHFSTKQHISLT